MVVLSASPPEELLSGEPNHFKEGLNDVFSPTFPAGQHEVATAPLELADQHFPAVFACAKFHKESVNCDGFWFTTSRTTELNRYQFDFIEGDFIPGAVVELGRARRFVSRDGLGVLNRAPVL